MPYNIVVKLLSTDLKVGAHRRRTEPPANGVVRLQFLLHPDHLIGRCRAQLIQELDLLDFQQS